jgi:hypothetical protein
MARDYVPHNAAYDTVSESFSVFMGAFEKTLGATGVSIPAKNAPYGGLLCKKFPYGSFKYVFGDTKTEKEFL